jgi:DNA replication licensing factor MCM2
LALFGGV